MSGFSFGNNGGKCDGVDLSSIVHAEGSPLYVYSGALIEERYRALDGAFGAYPHRIHYALKANSTLELVRSVHDLGGGFDANSGAEIDVALRANADPSDIVFTGVGKTDAEIFQAVALGLCAINVESVGELIRVNRIASAQDKRVPVAIRVNPDVDAQSHPGISTGGRAHKFGVPLDEAGNLCREISDWSGIRLVGVHAHIGSQITTIEPIRRVAGMMTNFAESLLTDGIVLEHIDLGGGLGISYDGEPVLDVNEYSKVILDAVAPTGLQLLLEPGRWIVGPVGVLLARVVDIKPQLSGRHFVVLDAGMTELMRPALYDATHRVEPVVPTVNAEATCDIVGPICETTDVIRLGCKMPLPEIGDVMAVKDVGAYGVSMASNYNRRPLPAEVLVKKGRAELIRRRQTIDDMLSCEC